MGYRGLRECVNDLERTGQLIRIDQEIDARLEAAEIQRRVYQAGGPAIYFANVRDCKFSDGEQSVWNTRTHTVYLS